MVVSIQRLKIDLIWDPIRNDPGFRRSNVTPRLSNSRGRL
jgi:hypothetical protein